MSFQALEKWGNWGQIAPGVANGQSEIKFTKLEFARPESLANQFEPDEGFTGLIQAVIFEVNDRNRIGYPTSQGYRYCCTKELVPKTKCSLERLIYHVSNSMLEIFSDSQVTLAIGHKLQLPHQWQSIGALLAVLLMVNLHLSFKLSNAE